jgi:Uncharacterised nucleotidyltransferase
VKDARLLARVLVNPASANALTTEQWSALLGMAHAERLSGSLAHQLRGIAVPETTQRFLERAALTAAQGRLEALWEVEMARRALVPLGVPVILLKGSAFVAAGFEAGQGRQIGDLDILVARADLPAVEQAVLAAGWDWLKPDPYDDHYYRTWMHELPPLAHVERGRMIDIHHTILPLTARVRPNAQALIAESIALENGLRILSPQDMVVHAVAHLLADGDLAGGLRNLWDIDRLLREHGTTSGFWSVLKERAELHGLMAHVGRALRLCHHIFGTPVDATLAGKARKGDVFYVGRLLARYGWGQETRGPLRLAFYVRSHWLRMPPIMLARHLWTKWRKRSPQQK